MLLRGGQEEKRTWHKLWGGDLGSHYPPATSLGPFLEDHLILQSAMADGFPDEDPCRNPVSLKAIFNVLKTM